MQQSGGVALAIDPMRDPAPQLDDWLTKAEVVELDVPPKTLVTDAVCDQSPCLEIDADSAGLLGGDACLPPK